MVQQFSERGMRDIYSLYYCHAEEFTEIEKSLKSRYDFPLMKLIDMALWIEGGGLSTNG
jgi:hypothetical protein